MFDILVVIFFSLYFVLAILGIAKPRLFLPLFKWHASIFGKLYGFDVKVKSDDVLIKRLRIWYILFLIVGIVLISLMIRDYLKVG